MSIHWAYQSLKFSNLTSWKVVIAYHQTKLIISILHKDKDRKPVSCQQPDSQVSGMGKLAGLNNEQLCHLLQSPVLKGKSTDSS